MQRSLFASYRTKNHRRCSTRCWTRLTTALTFGVVACSVLLLGAVAPALAADAPKRPNVVLVMTDDQGYGDLSCHGNPVLKTPSLDRLYEESIRLTDFHVDPTCSPTRSALMTGRYSCRTGVWHTIMGRSMLCRDEVTLADAFASAGYKTGIFGKWHLGDNYPFRPGDRGFEERLIHGGGGIGQTPDYWGNTYFSPVLCHNGAWKKSDGYCTDGFFDAALRFIAANKDRPFFVYLPTNVPHGPYQVDEAYSRPFREAGLPEHVANFYGMLVNFDENMGRLLDRLAQLDLERNTILIFMTDNGTSAGAFNAGMRGHKGSEYDGGHRVPCFIRWKGQLPAGRDIDRLTAHVDLMPTLLELCNIPAPKDVEFDGMSLVPLLQTGGESWPRRTLIVQSQRIEHPEKWRKCSVMTDRWRLINGRELYDMEADPGQQHDVAPDHPEVVHILRSEYEDFWRSASTRFDEYCRIVLGADKANPTELTCHDWHGPKVPWHQRYIARRMPANGFWAVDVAQAGRYEITLRERPAVADYPLPAGAVARVEIGGQREIRPVEPSATGVTFEMDLPAGPAKLQTWIAERQGQVRGAYFVEVRRLGSAAAAQ